MYVRACVHLFSTLISVIAAFHIFYLKVCCTKKCFAVISSTSSSNNSNVDYVKHLSGRTDGLTSTSTTTTTLWKSSLTGCSVSGRQLLPVGVLLVCDMSWLVCHIQWHVVTSVSQGSVSTLSTGTRVSGTHRTLSGVVSTPLVLSHDTAGWF